MDLVANVLAIITAPIVALIVGYYLQQWNAARERRLYIFRTLIGERATFVSRLAIAAMNLIVIEFRNNPDVLRAWEKFFDYVNGGHDFQKREVQEQANTLRAAMLLEMAKVLKMDRHIKLPELSRGYYPDWVSLPDSAIREILLRTFAAMKETSGIPVALVYPQVPPVQQGGPGGPPAKR